LTVLEQYDLAHDTLAHLVDNYDVTGGDDFVDGFAKTLFLFVGTHIQELHFSERVKQPNYDPAADPEASPVFRDAVNDVIKLAEDFKDTATLEPQFETALEAALMTFRANQAMRSRLTETLTSTTV